MINFNIKFIGGPKDGEETNAAFENDNWNTEDNRNIFVAPNMDIIDTKPEDAFKPLKLGRYYIERENGVGILEATWKGHS